MNPEGGCGLPMEGDVGAVVAQWLGCLTLGLTLDTYNLKGPESEWSNPEKFKFYFMKPHCSRVDIGHFR